MPLIRTRINYRNFALSGSAENQTIGVLTKDGHYQHRPWRGFVERQEALTLYGAIPVKLFVMAYTIDENALGIWIELKPEEAIQGCLFDGQVRAVIENGIPRVVRRTTIDPMGRGTTTLQ